MEHQLDFIVCIHILNDPLEAKNTHQFQDCKQFEKRIYITQHQAWHLVQRYGRYNVNEEHSFEIIDCDLSPAINLFPSQQILLSGVEVHQNIEEEDAVNVVVEDIQDAQIAEWAVLMFYKRLLVRKPRTQKDR